MTAVTRSGLAPGEEREVMDALALEGVVARSAVAVVVGAARAGAVHAADGAYVTPREAEVLRLVAAGLTNARIAAQLGLSPHTVKRHLANVCTRASLTGRAQAVAFALRHGLA